MTEMGFYSLNMGLASALPDWGDLTKKKKPKQNKDKKQYMHVPKSGAVSLYGCHS